MKESVYYALDSQWGCLKETDSQMYITLLRFEKYMWFKAKCKLDSISVGTTNFTLDFTRVPTCIFIPDTREGFSLQYQETRCA